MSLRKYIFIKIGSTCWPQNQAIRATLHHQRHLVIFILYFPVRFGWMAKSFETVIAWSRLVFQSFVVQKVDSAWGWRRRNLNISLERCDVFSFYIFCLICYSKVTGLTARVGTTGARLMRWALHLSISPLLPSGIRPSQRKMFICWGVRCQRQPESLRIIVKLPSSGSIRQVQHVLVVKYGWTRKFTYGKTDCLRLAT
jgi:hypothetical protein